MALCRELWRNNLGKTLFCSSTNQSPFNHLQIGLVWKELDWPNIKVFRQEREDNSTKHLSSKLPTSPYNRECKFILQKGHANILISTFFWNGHMSPFYSDACHPVYCLCGPALILIRRHGESDFQCGNITLDVAKFPFNVIKIRRGENSWSSFGVLLTSYHKKDSCKRSFSKINAGKKKKRHRGMHARESKELPPCLKAYSQARA